MGQFKVIKISESGNSAMIPVKGHARNMGNKLAYVQLLEEEKGNVKKGDVLTIDEPFTLVTKVDENNETMCYENGEAILFCEF
jgi:hypothetical protein